MMLSWLPPALAVTVPAALFGAGPVPRLPRQGGYFKRDEAHIMTSPTKLTLSDLSQSGDRTREPVGVPNRLFEAVGE